MLVRIGSAVLLLSSVFALNSKQLPKTKLHKVATQADGRQEKDGRADPHKHQQQKSKLLMAGQGTVAGRPKASGLETLHWCPAGTVADYVMLLL